MSVAPGSVATGVSLWAASSFQFARSLGFYGGKVQIHNQINTVLSDLLAILIPCPEDLNIGQTNMCGFPAWYHAGKIDTRIVPDVTTKFLGLTKIFSSPTKNHCRVPTQPVSPAGHLPGADSILATPSPRRSGRPNMRYSPHSRPLSHLCYFPLLSKPVAEDDTDIIPGLNYHYKAPAIAPAPAVRPHYSPDGSIISISSTSTIMDDAATVISISSDSSDSVGCLHYPLDSDVVYDILTPVCLVVFVNDRDPPSRMTIYPREADLPNTLLSLRVHNFHDALLAIGFNTNINGQVYLEYTSTWTPQMWEIGIPITCPNRIVFVRSYKAISADIDSFFNTLF
ncbi:hypothetical protein C8J57DRAFT_1528028 [Mycena rebaudengoi]|nr:hypothetical protein C8J57DRAFT_1528028 [Mycena rebaudengoi]